MAAAVTGRLENGVVGYFWRPCPIATGSDLRGQPLRYLLVALIDQSGGPMSVKELIAGCANHGVVFEGRASKIISDALRWERRRGRVRRLRRGVYTIGRVPRSTMHWIRQRTEQTKHWLEWTNDHRQNPTADPLLAASKAVWNADTWVPPWPYWPTTPT